MTIEDAAKEKYYANGMRLLKIFHENDLLIEEQLDWMDNFLVEFLQLNRVKV